jgi:SAM-dependent methyltransferase
LQSQDVALSRKGWNVAESQFRIAQFGSDTPMPDLRHNIAQCPRSGAPAQACGDFGWRAFMSGGWDYSAGAWIVAMGERGDWGREHVLDPIMLGRASARPFERVLDVGCGEGRFCRMLKTMDISVVGIDPTEELLMQARRRDPSGDYRLARAEALPFPDESFDLVISYLTLIDIADFRKAVTQMVRVLKRDGTVLIANVNSFITSSPTGWVRDPDGRYLHYPVDRYLDEFPAWVEWAGIRVENWHRPLASYMREFLDHGLVLTFFDEPLPVSGEPARQARYRRAPWFMVMEWSRTKWSTTIGGPTRLRAKGSGSGRSPPGSAKITRKKWKSG